VGDLQIDPDLLFGEDDGMMDDPFEDHLFPSGGADEVSSGVEDNEEDEYVEEDEGVLAELEGDGRAREEDAVFK
jgi:hypothetical protein